MGFDAGMDIIEFDSFDTAFPVEPGNEGAVKRRFMTLFAQTGASASAGGTSYVCKVQSFTGEAFALKRLLPQAGIPEDVTLSEEDTARITQGHAAAFYEEYKNQLLVSRLRGFPAVYGYGSIAGNPAILMEWVEGVSLRTLARKLAKDSETGLRGATVARVGLSVLQVLETLGRLDATLVHRDISPSNIMIRTDNASLEKQLASGSLDICLIDFGSATAQQREDPSFTALSNVWRNGTPEYAAPEMLTQDIPGVDEMRKSQKIDVFALCSVLYELYCSKTPWQVAEHTDVSPYRLKTQGLPAVLQAKEPGDAPLVAAIMSGLAIEQDARPSVHSLAEKLGDYLLASERLKQGVLKDAPEASRRRRSDTEVTADADLYTPDSTHLRVANADEGGRRASEPIPAFERKERVITRRTLVAGAGALVAAAILGGVGTRIFGGQTDNVRARQISGAALANAIYSDVGPYLALMNNAGGWKLLFPEQSTPLPLETCGHEPGPVVNGLVRVYYDDSTDYSSGWGFQTLENTDGKLKTRWALGNTYANARDFSSLANPADPQNPSLRLAAVQDAESGLWGFIDTSGRNHSGAFFADADIYSNGYAAVQLNQDDRPWTLIDAQGNLQAGLHAASLGLCSAEGLVACRKKGEHKWCFVRPDGSAAFNGVWQFVRRFTCGLAGIQNEGGSLWGFINADGSQVIEAAFADVRPFATATEDGAPLAPAQDAKTQLWGLIDTSGAWRVKPRFLKLGEKRGNLWPAHGSPVNVYTPYDPEDPAWVAYIDAGGDSDGTFGYGYINDAGDWVFEPNYADTLIRASAQ